MIIKFMNSTDKRKLMNGSRYYSLSSMSKARVSSFRNRQLTHEGLAKILEHKYTPYYKFYDYAGKNTSGVKQKIIASLLTIDNEKALTAYITQDTMRSSWLHFMKNNLGKFRSENPTPLIDTKQYVGNLRFKCILNGKEKLALDKLKRLPLEARVKVLKDLRVSFSRFKSY